VQSLLQWKSNKYYLLRVCVFSLRYQACNAHAPHFNLLPARLSSIFPHYLINGTILVKKSLDRKRVFGFYLQILSATFLILRIMQRDIIIIVNRSSRKVPVILSDFKEP